MQEKKKRSQKDFMFAPLTEFPCETTEIARNEALRRIMDSYQTRKIILMEFYLRYPLLHVEDQREKWKMII